MGWSIGYDSNWKRDIGYGVTAYCDHPRCNETIDRGLSYVCGGGAYGHSNIEYRKDGCGLYFCSEHLNYENRCPKCARYDNKPYKPKPEHPEWIKWKLTDESWAAWREENKEEVIAIRRACMRKKHRHRYDKCAFRSDCPRMCTSHKLSDTQFCKCGAKKP